jgi:hypothetical protein
MSRISDIKDKAATANASEKRRNAIIAILSERILEKLGEADAI